MLRPQNYYQSYKKSTLKRTITPEYVGPNRKRFAKTRTTKYATSIPAIRQLITKELSKKSEKKVIQSQYNMLCYYATSGPDVFTWRNLFPLTPYDSAGAPVDATMSLTQGTGQGSRIGNSVRPYKVMFRGVMHPTPYGTEPPSGSEPKPMEVCLWIFKLRGTAPTSGLGDTLAGAEEVLENNFLQNQTNTGNFEGITGELIDIIKPVNNDVVTLCYKRVFKIGTQHILQSNQGNITNVQRYHNNDYKYNQKFAIDITKYIPKNILYNDNDDMPSIQHTYCCIVPYNADGVSAANSTIAPLRVHWTVTMEFTDN